ncbi:MAG: hypothetical protein AB6733_19135 [Clostridiaceae bacterium]
MDLDKLVSECIHSSIDYGVTAYEVITNPKKTNKLYKVNSYNFKKLKSQGSEGVTVLLNLLEHENDYVRYIAATYVLSIEEDKAKKVLSDLCTRSGIFGFSAKLLLEEWNKGNLINSFD